MSATLLLAAFVAYLYFPFLLFTFFAEDSIDIGRLKDESRIGEFFGAALPSALLNMLTWLTLHLFFAIDPWHVVRSPAIDWPTVASSLDQTYTSLRAHIAAGPAGEIQYLAVRICWLQHAEAYMAGLNLRLLLGAPSANSSSGAERSDAISYGFSRSRSGGFGFVFCGAHLTVVRLDGNRNMDDRPHERPTLLRKSLRVCEGDERRDREHRTG